MRSLEASSSISDSNGNLLFYTNGIYIANANHDTMMNGNGFGHEGFKGMNSGNEANHSNN